MSFQVLAVKPVLGMHTQNLDPNHLNGFACIFDNSREIKALSVRQL